jgi:hypothetical protein
MSSGNIQISEEDVNSLLDAFTDGERRKRNKAKRDRKKARGKK